MKKSLLNFLLNRPVIVILVVAVLTIFFGFNLRNGLQLDVSPMLFVEERSQERTDFNTARKSFGDDLYLIVAAVSDDALKPDNLRRLRNLHKKIAGTDGVEEVLSLINAPFARATANGVSLENLVPDDQADAVRWQEMRQIALSDPLYAGQLISRDAQTAAIYVLMKSNLPTERRHQISAEIYQDSKNAGFRETYVSGDPFTQWRSTQSLRSDIQIFLPVTVTLIAFLLWLCFRTLRAVFLPLLTVGIGLIWVFGTMALLKASFNILSLMLPTILLAIGCSYVIHILNQIGLDKNSESPGSDEPRLLLFKSLDFISTPVIVSALTIIAGSLSLALTKIPGIRSTAVFAALGAAYTMILALTFVPSVLSIMGDRGKPINTGLSGKLVDILEATGRWAVNNEKLLYAITGLFCFLSVIGIFRIIVNVDFYGFFRPTSEVSINTIEIGKRLVGAFSFDVVIEGEQSNYFKDPNKLKSLETLQKTADQSSRGQSISIVDFIKHANRAFHHNDPQYSVLPEDHRIVAELLTDQDSVRKFITEDNRRARILVRTTLSGSAEMSKTIHAIEAKGKELFPDGRVYATGTVALMNKTSDAIAREQLQSISIALFTIYVVLTFLFRSWRVGITALVPNLIPVLFFFGFMGWRGITLNMTTSLVASVVLGLAVDNAVQFIVRFRRVQPSQPDIRQAIIESMRLSGRPIIYANIAIAAAFAVFVLSDFWPVRTFGILSAVTILGCLVEDLVLLPARLTSPVFQATSKKT